jgi:small-conductance mechanosensitive channel
MDVIEQAGNVRASVQRRMRDHRDERLETTNQALRTENRALRDQLARERSTAEMALAGTAPRKHRIRRTLAVVIAAGGAYVAGTKAGRERYEQMRTWLSGTKEDLADHAGETLEQTAEKARDVANEIAQKTGDEAAETAARASRKIVGPR